MHENALMTENLALLDAIRGTAASNNVLTTAYVQPDMIRKLLAVFHLFAPTDAETVTFRLLKASDVAGTGAEAIKATTLVAHATNNDDTVHCINYDQAEVDDAKPFLAASITTSSTGGTACSVQLWGGSYRQWPASQYNSAKLVTITE